MHFILRKLLCPALAALSLALPLAACAPGAETLNPEAAVMRDQLKPVLQAMLDQAAAETGATAGRLKGRSLSGPEAREALAGLVARFPGWVEDAVTVDLAGRIVIVEPVKYKAAEGADISRAPDIQLLLKSARPVLSGVGPSAEGIEAAAIEHPVFNADGSLAGGISLLFKPAAFIGDVLKGRTGGVDIEVLVLDLKSRVLWDKDPSQIGRVTLTDPLYRDYPKLVSLVGEIVSRPEGTGSYEFPSPGRSGPVRKDATWTTVSLYGTEWRLIAAKVAF